MNLRGIRTRHVYASALAAFVALLGFEGARMAAGHDPALAASPAATAAPTPDEGFGGGLPPDDPGLSDPNLQDGGQQLPQDVPQPESRLS